MEDYHEAEAVELQNPGVSINELVDHAIETLPEKCRHIYTLSKKEGLSYQEIALHLEISEKTVENQIGIALRKLRETLKPHISLIYE